MIKLLILTLILLSSSVHAVMKCDRWNQLSLEQKANLHLAFFLGSEHDYGWTLAAIALIESNAGKWRLNYRSNDFGLFQVNIETASNILEIQNRYKRFDLAERLLYDDVLGADLAVNVLEHFRRNRTLTNTVYKEIIFSYNRGYSWKRDKQKRKEAELYYDNFRLTLLMLKQCSNLGE